MTEEEKKVWLDANSHHSKLLAYSILPLLPDIGGFVEVNGLKIPRNIFPEEYDAITNHYYTMLDKLSKHFDKVHGNKPYPTFLK